VLKEQSLMEQRYDAVVAVIRDQMTVSEVAEKFGISRQSLYRWMARYEEGGLEALQDRSHRPKRVPHQMRVDVEVRALELRRRHMAWGPIRLRHELLKEFAQDLVPSQMAIYRALLRHGLVEPRPSRKRLRARCSCASCSKKSYRSSRHWPASRPMPRAVTVTQPSFSSI